MPFQVTPLIMPVHQNVPWSVPQTDQVSKPMQGWSARDAKSGQIRQTCLNCPRYAWSAHIIGTSVICSFQRMPSLSCHFGPWQNDQSFLSDHVRFCRFFSFLLVLVVAISLIFLLHKQLNPGYTLLVLRLIIFSTIWSCTSWVTNHPHSDMT